MNPSILLVALFGPIWAPLTYAEEISVCIRVHVQKQQWKNQAGQLTRLDKLLSAEERPICARSTLWSGTVATDAIGREV